MERDLTILAATISELNSLLRAALPPSPMQNIPALDIAVSGAVTKGSSTAKLAVIEFADFQCPFCGRHFQSTYQELQRNYVETGKLVYIFKNLPLEDIHPLALKAAEAGECAREQDKFWEMHDRLFTHQNALTPSDLVEHGESVGLDVVTFKHCLDDGNKSAVIRRDLDEAQRLGLTGTPAFFLGEVQPNGIVTVTKRIVGAQPMQVFQAALQSLLEKMTKAVPR
jgi:protein-disulfide isomerase